MAGGSAGNDLRNQLNTLTQVGVVGNLSDGQLLQRFLTARDGADQAAFTALVGRHGAMVLHVCRQVLGDAYDSEDAFQATFLVLARRAGSVQRADSVASWLHGVALRVAVRARGAAARRRLYERRSAAMKAGRPDGDGGRQECWTELHEEIARLPERYREPVVLCYLEGLSTEAAATRVGCPRGTILSRLARGRERLRDRLTRRGLAPATGLFTEDRHRESAPAAVSEPLLLATAESATLIIKGSATAGPVSVSAVSLTEGVLHAMFWTKLKTAGFFGLALAALVVGAGATLAYQETRKEGRAAPSQKAPEGPATPVVRTPDAARSAAPSAVFIVALPPRGELHALLRRAAGEAVALARTKPMPSSWTLTAVAVAQARAGDLDGARATFADAAREAGGEFGGAAFARGLWRVGHFQAKAGLKEQARSTLKRALEPQPGVTGEYNKDYQALEMFALIVQEQARVGAREDARETADRFLEFSRKVFESTEDVNARDAAAPRIAAALAAVGDFEAAFGWSAGVQNGGHVLGEIAGAASQCLDREDARRFVREAAERLAKLERADQTYFGLGDLAEAQARLGDVKAARLSARAIGEGPSLVNYDMTDGQPYALCRVANVQREAGDTDGARETLRDAFRSVSDHPIMRGRDGRYFQISMAQIASGDIDGALKTVEAMEVRGAGSLARIARAQAAAGQQADARATFALALGAAGLSVKDPPPPSAELAKLPGVRHDMPGSARMNLAMVQAIGGDVPGALKTLRSIDDPDYQRFALEKVVSARATAGDVAGALRLGLDESRTPEERRSSLQGLGEGVEARLLLKSLDPRAE